MISIITLKELCAAKVRIFHRVSPRASDSVGTELPRFRGDRPGQGLGASVKGTHTLSSK